MGSFDVNMAGVVILVGQVEFHEAVSMNINAYTFNTNGVAQTGVGSFEAGPWGSMLTFAPASTKQRPMGGEVTELNAEGGCMSRD
jgi:hypothetical protein